MPHMKKPWQQWKGASVWVHVYNGMRGFTHREPGMVGAAFDSPETIGELIADGHHAVPVACKVLIKQKTPQGVALITDCMSAEAVRTATIC